MEKDILGTITRILIEYGKQKQLITYSELSNLVNKKLNKKVVLPVNIHKYLHDICENSYKEKGFMLGALVISKKLKMPSNGFFKFAEKVVGKRFLSDDEKKDFWINELKKIYQEFDS